MKTRVQFGQTIGSFQALQHRAAKMFTDIQLARPTVEAALQALDAGQEDAPALVSLAKATANDLANLLTREMIQLHGGIGMTDPHDAGFYIKRARVLNRRSERQPIIGSATAASSACEGALVRRFRNSPWVDGGLGANFGIMSHTRKD